MAAMQDPKMMEVMGQNPMAQVLMQAANAHITEHVAFAYREQLQRQMGVTLPAPDAELPEDVEVQLSRLSAEASGQLLGKHQAEAQAQKNAEMQEDPVIQMQQAELQIKQQELQLKTQKLQLDAASEADKMAFEREKLAAELEKEGLRIGSQSAAQRAKLETQQQLEILKAGQRAEESQARQQAEGMRMGVDVAKAKAQMQVQKDIQQPKKGNE